jgi:dihydropyrimidinase
MNVDYNCYEGMQVQGVTETVLSRGKVVIENEKYVGKAGDGKFQKRSTVQLKHREVATAGR